MKFLIAASLLAFATTPALAQEAQPAAGRVLSPAQVSLDDQPVERLGPRVSRQVIHGTAMTLSRWELGAGSVVPMHHHANEQMSWVLSGRISITSGGVDYILGPGDVLVIPPYVEHAVEVLEDTVAVDLFAPVRQDWIDRAVAGE